MEHSSDGFVAVIAILCVFGLPMAYCIANRVYAHQERLEMIRRGITPPPDSRWARRMARAAWVPPTGQPAAVDPEAQIRSEAGCMLRRGITVGMIGLALLVGLSFINPERPGPWLLGGLIPLFVGVAQVIIAVLSGASLTPPQRQSVFPPPQNGGHFAEPPPFTRDVTPGPPYGWRPGTTTELESPAKPPDVK